LFITYYCYECTCDQGTIGSVAALRHSRTPGGDYGLSYVRKVARRALVAHGATKGFTGPRLRDIRIDWIDERSRLPGRSDNAATWAILGLQRFYIRLGHHLLDRSFVLNSNSILIYWYSFTSNELYFQV
jgi:hypothetical protein